MIGLVQCLLVLENQLFNAAKILRPDAPVTCQADGWLQPEFAFTLRGSDVDVRGLLSFIGIEVKTK